MTTRKAPTLADKLIHEYSHKRYRDYDPHSWISRTIASARKFVLDG